MKKILLKTAVTLGLLLGMSALLIYWHEADKEIRILCSMFSEGTSEEQVVTTLNTANLLDYSFSQNHENRRVLKAISAHNLFASECRVILSESGDVLQAIYSQHFNLNAVLATTGCTVLLVLAFFQLLLSMGQPYGKYFWGGYYKILPVKLRIGSFISFILLSFCLIVLSHQLNEVDILPSGFPFSEFHLFFAVLFLLSTLANANSESEKEMKLMTPVATILYLAFLSAIFVL